MKYKYTVNNKRITGFVAGLLLYGAVSLWASIGVGGSNVAKGIAIHLSLAAVNAVATLVLIFKPVERKEISEKAQTVPSCGDCATDSGHH